MFSSRVILFKDAQENREDLLVYFKNRKVKEIVEALFQIIFIRI